MTRRGFGPWLRIYRPSHDGRRQCVQLARYEATVLVAAINEWL
ncbi:hypothetical protein [Streptomyces chartreusis]|nr:hypothetical protein [Streptomyces chartreusis]WUB23763.1 hypothetical protein OG997_44160 [Streptomyces chartreusis]